MIDIPKADHTENYGTQAHLSRRQFVLAMLGIPFFRSPILNAVEDLATPNARINAELLATASELGITPEALAAVAAVQGTVSNTNNNGEASIYKDADGNVFITTVKHVIAAPDNSIDRASVFRFANLNVRTSAGDQNVFMPVGAPMEQFDSVMRLGLLPDSLTLSKMDAETRSNLPRIATQAEVAASFRGELVMFSISPSDSSVTTKTISRYGIDSLEVNGTTYGVGANFMTVDGRENPGESGEALYAVSNGIVIFLGVVSRYLTSGTRANGEQIDARDITLYCLVENH